MTRGAGGAGLSRNLRMMLTKVAKDWAPFECEQTKAGA